MNASLQQGTIMIMAGGTGGHVIPALTVAQRLQEAGFATIWLGTRAGIEARLVPAAGIDIEWIPVTGLRDKGRLALLLAPFRLLRAAWHANGAFRRHRPHAVLGMGGFASGPGGLVAWLRRTPLVVHEQNSIAGMTNRILARLTQHVLAAFPSAFDSKPGVEIVGNPVRDELGKLPAPDVRFAGREGPLRVLVIGGSQGARSLNTMVPVALAGFASEITVRHQCGREEVAGIEKRYADNNIPVSVEPFIDDMAAAYGWADIAICRAGAMTVFELAAAGLGSILVPYPHAVDDHQTSNAAYLVNASAAEILQERDFEPASLAKMFERLARRDVLQEMAMNARRQAMPGATDAVAERCMQLARQGGAA
jgi:UDP-N-acetylglucosamine--N-acetylmuramyl-(pentapeptide) pyrophosphoryl-undecaprenol N-acetylglucosamine transferase